MEWIRKKVAFYYCIQQSKFKDLAYINLSQIDTVKILFVGNDD